MSLLALAAPLAAARRGGARGSPARRRRARLEEANARRHAGDAKGALEGYKAVLAELGDAPLPGTTRRCAGRRSSSRATSRTSSSATTPARSRTTGASSRSTRAARRRARRASMIGDIYRERFRDPLAAIAQYADVAASDAPEAPRYQLEVARAYLELQTGRRRPHRGAHPREKWPITRSPTRRSSSPRRPGRSRSATTRRSARSRRSSIASRARRSCARARGPGPHPRAGGPLRPRARAVRARPSTRTRTRSGPTSRRSRERRERRGRRRCPAIAPPRSARKGRREPT